MRLKIGPTDPGPRSGFFVVAGASVRYLWTGSRTADHLAEAAAEVGILFCTVGLIMGSLWARPIWGVWFTWDPRLTMTVILWSIYTSYIMLRAFGGDLPLALAGFRLGPDAVERHGGVPAYSDMRAYLPMVMGYYDEFRAAGTFGAPTTGPPNGAGTTTDREGRC